MESKNFYKDMNTFYDIIKKEDETSDTVNQCHKSCIAAITCILCFQNKN